ncbi:unnamed protein product, partial [Iphiclides podalirius]
MGRLVLVASSAHPNCAIFITHGGLLSTTEAVHFGVPLIGIPVFFDQNFNVDFSVKRGIALKVVLTENGARDLRNAIHEILNNPKFYENLEKRTYEEFFTPIVEKRGRSLPPYEELRYNASFIFGNSHVSLGQAVTLPQNYIPIAGYHIQQDIKSLPKYLKKILDDAKYGVIYFSLGSNLKSKISLTT